MRLPAVVAPTILFAALTALATPGSTQSLAITGGTVIDGTGRPPMSNAVVLITDGKIAAVGAAGAVTIPAGARRIDASGKYLIPGLMDANLHLMINIDVETLVKYEDRFHEIVLEAAQIALKTGQTTVFDTWGPRAALVKARDMINAGQAVGSRIYIAGNIIGFDGPFSDDFFAAAAPHVSKAFAKRINDAWEQGTGRNLLWLTPDEVGTAITAYAKTGVNFLKYGGSGHSQMNFATFSPRQQKAIIDAGHRAGMTVQAHTTSVETMDMAIEAGLDIVTHGDISGPVRPYPEETIRKLVERGIAVSVLAVTQRHLDAQKKLPTPGLLTPYLEVAKTNERNMIKAGVRLLISTDAGIENPVTLLDAPSVAADTVDHRVKLGESHVNAMIGLEELGMTPMELLKSATSNIAKAYKLDALIGTLEKGKLADVVILDANPLEGARNYRRVNMVIKDGKVVDIGALPLAPIISAKAPGR